MNDAMNIDNVITDGMENEVGIDNENAKAFSAQS
jgi:hypothetical protein